jgi:hypothetical protein
MIFLMFTLISPAAFAQRDDREGNKGGSKVENRGGSRENNKVDNRAPSRGDRHYYRNGKWYKRGWFGFSIAVSALTIGAVIESLPPRTTIVVVGGTQYYHDDQYYYRQAPEGGYVVVQQPVIVQTQIRIR